MSSVSHDPLRLRPIEIIGIASAWTFVGLLAAAGRVVDPRGPLLSSDLNKALIVLSFTVYVLGPLFWREAIYRNKTIYDIIALTPLAWGWMFGFGILAVKRFDIVQRGLKYLPFAVVAMAAMIWLSGGPLFASVGNRLGLFYFISYAALVLWFAFATPYIRLKFDLSYGIYVWHMPVINLLLVLALPSAPLAFVLTLSISGLSWMLVEKPALKLKRQSLKPIDVSQVHLAQGLVGEIVP